MRVEIPRKGMNTILSIYMKSIKINREDNILKHKSYRDKIQRYTRPLMTFPEPDSP